MDMEWYLYPLTILAGAVAGFINTLAGSGSLVTLPLLIFIGLPATVANGTNRVGILLQNIVGMNSFRRQEMLDIRCVWYLGIPAVIGSILGAQIAVSLNETLMRRVIGIIMVVMLFVILLRPRRWLTGEVNTIATRPTLLQLAIFFVIGIYGGFIQAGVGIFLLAGLVLVVGYDVVRANAVKVGIVLFFTIFALAIFVANDQVNWMVGFILAIGNMIGAWLGARVAVEAGAIWVRRLLILVVIISAANLLGIFDWISNILNI
jgi:uncharacterized membrane protein YfcA